MKKLLLVLVLSLICLLGSAQTRLNSYALQVGHWNYYSQTYNWDAIKICDVKFFLQGDIIIANDAAESTYYTYEVITQNDYAASWNAFDEQKRKCIVSLLYDEEVCFIVIYDNICYKYFVTINSD
jgi:hypothetical protein